MIDPRGIKSFLATLYITDVDASMADSSAISCDASFARTQDGRLAVDQARRDGLPVGGEASDGFACRPIAVAGGRIDVLGAYGHRWGIGGVEQANSICAGANLCLFRGTVSNGATDGFHNFTIRRTGSGNRLSPLKTFIWQTNRFWGKGDALCELPIGDDESAFGISYDPFRESLWVQVGPEFAIPGGSYRLLERGLDGTARSETTGPAIGLVSLLAGVLAMDDEAQSLWWIHFGDRRLGQSISHLGLRFDRIGRRLAYFFLEPRVASGVPCRPMRPIHGAEVELPEQVSERTSLPFVAAARGPAEGRGREAVLGHGSHSGSAYSWPARPSANCPAAAAPRTGRCPLIPRR